MGASITQQNFTATIANGAALSDAQVIGGLTPVGVVLPAAWTAANLTFSVSHDGGTTYTDLYDLTAEVAATAVGASRFIALDPTKFLGVNVLKIRSGTAALPVNQGGARSLVLVAKY